MTRRSTLSDTAIKNAKPAAKGFKLAEPGGLFVLVQPNGAKLWRYRFWLDSREGLLALGAYPDVGLKRARELHQEARALVAGGINPVHHQKAEKQKAEQRRQTEELGSFAAVVTSWRAKTEPDMRASSVAQRGRELANDLLPKLGLRQVSTITRLELAALLEAVKARAPETARNLRTHLDAIFEHAADKGLVAANPTPPRSFMGKRRQTSHAALPVDMLGSFLRAVDAAPCDPATRCAMLLVLLTGGRKAEVVGARWSEIGDLGQALLTVPSGRMKADREWLVPLPRQAVELLERHHSFTGDREFIFVNRRDARRPMASRSLNAFMDRNGFKDVATVHGFRSVFSTWANERGANADVVELCLAHAIKGVRGVYNRALYLDQRRELLQAWADFMDSCRDSTPESVESIQQVKYF
jgi:integrase